MPRSIRGRSSMENEHGTEYQGCGYQGYEFGARYLDSLCQGGWLQDMDSEYDSRDGDYKPCPQCRQTEAMDYYRQQLQVSYRPGRSGLYDAWHLVMDIRRNRGLPTIALRQYRRHVEIANAQDRKANQAAKKGAA